MKHFCICVDNDSDEKSSSKKKKLSMSNSAKITKLTNSDEKVKKEIQDYDVSRGKTKSFKSSFANIKDKLKCCLCGKNCKKEDWTTHPNYAKNKLMPVIKGLNCDLIYNKIYTSQRPCTYLIERYGLVQIFKSLDIKLVVNLQREGEHPYCIPNGYQLDKNTGFAYNPKCFQKFDIKCINSGWTDLTKQPSSRFILNIIKEIAVSIQEKQKKVFVHCHSGLGRSGIVAVCYLYFESCKVNKDIKLFIKSIQQQREGLIKKEAHLDFYVDKLKQLFFFEKTESLDYFMKNQLELLFGQNYTHYEKIPVIFSTIIDKLTKLTEVANFKVSDLITIICKFKDLSYDDKIIINLKLELNLEVIKVIEKTNDISLLIIILFEWLDKSLICLIELEHLLTIFNVMENVKDNINIFLLLDNGDADERTNLFNTIRSQFTQVENRCLEKLAFFFKIIKNKLTTDKKQMFCYGRESSTLEFHEMKYQICYYLLGKSKSSQNLDSDKHEAINNLINIIDFYSLVLYNKKSSYLDNKRENQLSDITESNNEYEITSVLFKSDYNVDICDKERTEENYHNKGEPNELSKSKSSKVTKLKTNSVNTKEYKNISISSKKDFNLEDFYRDYQSENSNSKDVKTIYEEDLISVNSLKFNTDYCFEKNIIFENEMVSISETSKQKPESIRKKIFDDL